MEATARSRWPVRTGSSSDRVLSLTGHWVARAPGPDPPSITRHFYGTRNHSACAESEALDNSGPAPASGSIAFISARKFSSASHQNVAAHASTSNSDESLNARLI